MDLSFREYRPNDLDAVYELDALCFDPVFRFSRGAMRRFAEAEDAVTVLAESQGELAGFAIAEVSERAGYVVTVDVRASWRGQGLGRRLMQDLEAKARAREAEAMLLHVFTKNEGAARMYEALGYERQGLARAFYGKGLDAWMYEKRFAAGTTAG